MHWIIDGYNVIRQVDCLQAEESRSLRAGRTALLELASGFLKDRLKGRGKVTVVFDGPVGDFLPFNDGPAGVEVLFSRGKSADHAIEERIRESANPADVTVVSADRGVQRFARMHRCATLNPGDFVSEALSADKPARSAKPSLHPHHQHKIEFELRKKWLRK